MRFFVYFMDVKNSAEFHNDETNFQPPHLSTAVDKGRQDKRSSKENRTLVVSHIVVPPSAFLRLSVHDDGCSNGTQFATPKWQRYLPEDLTNVSQNLLLTANSSYCPPRELQASDEARDIKAPPRSRGAQTAKDKVD